MTSEERNQRSVPLAIDLEMLRPVLRSGWGADTCDPHDVQDWHAGNAARGQCGVTALIIQDLLGGELILGEVLAGDVKVGYHYWNRLADGREVDLTADQFQPPEVVVGGQVQQRSPGPPRRCRQQYEILRGRVFAALYGGEPTQSTQP
ncbi:hypothetical protein QTQ03_18835 [Micromonospora sp. WMMA1363]|uniref:YunG family protein n=1 Tax=Micromonospora sp. WMMA1363 TaxID=3053985 RepID=UPI00259D0846|nr:hypothetical protein [Micromonospora sp. WMMA1363]MDM4721546.1 hypothetical protein [Micromonospora sp. WMMA1363]